MSDNEKNLDTEAVETPAEEVPAEETVETAETPDEGLFKVNTIGAGAAITFTGNTYAGTSWNPTSVVAGQVYYAPGYVAPQ